MEYLEMLIDAVLDSLEEFFEGLSIPTAKYTLHAFLVSLAFLPISVIAEMFGIICFVSWQESVTCSLILAVLACLDANNRSNVMKSANAVKFGATKAYTKANENLREAKKRLAKGKGNADDNEYEDSYEQQDEIVYEEESALYYTSESIDDYNTQVDYNLESED